MQISLEDFNEVWDASLDTDYQPWERPEILEVQPAPAWEPEAQKCYDRFQWILFLLRKAHMQPCPKAPADALVAAGETIPSRASSARYCFLPGAISEGSSYRGDSVVHLQEP